MPAVALLPHLSRRAFSAAPSFARAASSAIANGGVVAAASELKAFKAPVAAPAPKQSVVSYLQSKKASLSAAFASKKTAATCAVLPMLHLDTAEPWQYGFQDGASVTFEGITELHNSVMYFIIPITIGVFHGLGAVLYRFRAPKVPQSAKYLNHGTVIELIWTITPALVLIAIAFPSFRLLYLMDEVISPALTLKVMGHQWYWSYEYCDFSVGSEE